MIKSTDETSKQLFVIVFHWRLQIVKNCTVLRIQKQEGHDQVNWWDKKTAVCYCFSLEGLHIVKNCNVLQIRKQQGHDQVYWWDRQTAVCYYFSLEASHRQKLHFVTETRGSCSSQLMGQKSSCLLFFFIGGSSHRQKSSKIALCHGNGNKRVMIKSTDEAGKP